MLLTKNIYQRINLFLEILYSSKTENLHSKINYIIFAQKFENIFHNILEDISIFKKIIKLNKYN